MPLASLYVLEVNFPYHEDTVVTELLSFLCQDWWSNSVVVCSRGRQL